MNRTNAISSRNGGFSLPKVQVVMPTFNRPSMVQNAIQSVLIQTMKDFQLYVMDNSSEHQWPKVKSILSDIASKDSRVTFHHTVAEDRLRLQRHYVCIVTNTALFEISENEPYVVLTCDDIIMNAQKLEVLSTFLDTHGEFDAVAGMLYFINDSNRILQRLGGFSLKCAASMLDWCQPMYRRSLINKVGKFAEDTVPNADADYFERIAKVTDAIYGIPTPLDYANVKYRMTRGSKEKVERMLRGDLME